MQLVLDDPESKRRLLAHINARRDKLLSELATQLLDERKSDTIRGCLRELKSIESAITNEGANE